MNKPFHQEPALLFATPPNFDELCAVTVHLTDKVISTQLAGMQQPQIIKCREIVFTEPDVIATPSLFIPDTFHVIMTRAYFKSGKLHARFQRIGLEVEKPERVTGEVYQACLHYTLLARMAPLWNKVGEWMVQGREFLTHKGYASAVKMELVVSTKEMFISIAATSVRLPPVDILDLGLSTEQLQQLTQPSYLRQVEIPVSYCWCQVLPSMKKTRIISISNGIPQKGPFKSYKNFKRHWKNLYGYRLPETDESMLFFQVTFGPMTGKVFTYPDVCVKASRPQPLARVEPKPILAAFALDLYARLPAACGQPLRFLPKLRYFTPQLYPGTQELSSQGLAPNLCSRPSTTCTAPLRKQADLRLLFARQSSSLPILSSQVHSSHGKAAGDGASQEANGMVSQMESGASSAALSQSKPQAAAPTRGNMDSSTSRREDSSPAMSNQRSRAAMMNAPSGVPTPSAGDGFPSGSNNVQGNHAPNNGSAIKNLTGTNDRGSQRGIAEISQDNLRYNVVAEFPGTRGINGFNSASQLPVPSCSEEFKIRPVFQPRPQQSGTPKASGELLAEDGGPSTPKIVPFFKAKKRRLETPILKSKSNSASVSSPFKAARSCSAHSLAKPLGWSCGLPAEGKSQYFAAPLPTARPVLKNQAARTAVEQSPGQRVASSPSCSPASQRSLPPTPSPRPALLNNAKDGNKTESKKPRGKPQVQELDVESLAKTNQLQKANTATLQAWLKERGVACRSKDKKGDLVARVLAFLNLPVSEQ